MKKVLAFGTFDLFHPGHRNFLEQASQLGETLCICIARDLNVEKIKGKKPKWNENKRKQEIQNNFPNAQVILGNENTDKIYECLSEIKPDVIALGYDQKVYTEGLEKELEKRVLNTEIIRMKAYKEDVYKSSLMKE